ncbi:MAG TPA: hypothetical protein VGC34_00300, partial [Steroidobacteraceae bacterium]
MSGPIGSESTTMRARAPRFVIGLLAALTAVTSLAAAAPTTQTSGADLVKLKAIVDGSQRTAAHRARDKYRHPVETLAFFGIRPNMTVVELWPFGGWFTEIIAPYLKGTGTYYAAAMDPTSNDKEEKTYNAELKALFDAHPDLYSEV